MEMVSTELLEESSDNILWKNCIHYEDNEAACLLGKDGYRDNGIVSSPLFQVLSVTLISNNCIQDRVLRIYGSIWLTTWNSHGVITHVYTRSEDDPELVKPCFSLKLQDHVIVLTTCHVLHLELFVQSCSDNAIAISDQFVFDFTSKDFDYSQNKKITMGVDSNYSFQVICATFPFAVVAKVRAIYFCNAKKDETSEYIDEEDYWLGEFDANSKYGNDQRADNFSLGDANVFGEISASIYDHFGNYGTELTRHIPVTLLNRAVHEKPIKVKSGYFIKLSRSVLVVPSYSTLKVNVNIWDHNQKSQISVGVAKFLAQHDSVYRRDIVGENGYVRIRVEWRHLKQELKGRRHNDRLNISIAPKVSTCYMNDEGDMLLEVFSVVIFSYYDDEEDGKLCVHGKIVVDDYQDFIVYKREEDNPLNCCSSGTIVPIVCATRSLSSLDYVSIIVLLKDKEGGAFIEGGAHWNASSFIGMYDKRLCSIIRGDRGFAVVNYMAISDGLSAKIHIKLYANLNEDNCATKICGKIVARYGNYSYSTQHEKRLYQSIVFDSCEEFVSPSPEGVTLPLLKHTVVFPRTSSLIFEICLKVAPIIDDLSLHIFKEEVEFSISDGKICRRIIRGDAEYWMQVNVKFKNFDY